MLNVRNLYYSYGDFDVLKNVNFNVEKQQLCALFGPNGTGKSTLFKCITKLLDIKNRGEIFVQDKNIVKMPMSEVSKIITHVSQEHKASFPYKVKEIVLMGRTPHLGGIFGPKARDIEITIQAMEMAGIAHLAERVYTNLSGGQRQLVLFARAFAQDTDMLLLDEPTSALDYKNQLVLWNTIRNSTDQGKTILVCTHDPNHILWFCDSVIVLGKEGRIIAQGKPKDILCKELLQEIYGDLCEVKSINNHSFVVPNILKNESKVLDYSANFIGNEKEIFKIKI